MSDSVPMTFKQMKFAQITNLIKEALTAVDEDYFLIKVMEQPSGQKVVARERVFCYELYHQFRNLMDSRDPLRFHGELTKRGHYLFTGKNKRTPDFLIHYPGRMSFNLTVIEVKAYRNLKKKGLKKDIETILRFMRDCEYFSGILIVYGCTMSELSEWFVHIVSATNGLENIGSHVENVLIITAKTTENNDHEVDQVWLKELL